MVDYNIWTQIAQSVEPLVCQSRVWGFEPQTGQHFVMWYMCNVTMMLMWLCNDMCGCSCAVTWFDVVWCDVMWQWCWCDYVMICVGVAVLWLWYVTMMWGVEGWVWVSVAGWVSVGECVWVSVGGMVRWVSVTYVRVGWWEGGETDVSRSQFRGLLLQYVILFSLAFQQFYVNM